MTFSTWDRRKVGCPSLCNKSGRYTRHITIKMTGPCHKRNNKVCDDSNFITLTNIPCECYCGVFASSPFRVKCLFPHCLGTELDDLPWSLLYILLLRVVTELVPIDKVHTLPLNYCCIYLYHYGTPHPSRNMLTMQFDRWQYKMSTGRYWRHSNDTSRICMLFHGYINRHLTVDLRLCHL